MQAIIRHSGRQFVVKAGGTIDLDLSPLEAGSKIELTEVLYVGKEGGPSSVGKPLVRGAKVIGKVLGVKNGPKLIAAAFRRRKNSRRRIGHRQKFTRVLIESIQA